MSKQTAVEWLFAHLLPFLPFSDAKEREHFRKCLEEAKAMERDQMMELISFVRVHNKMGKSVEDLLQQFETYKEGEQ